MTAATIAEALEGKREGHNWRCLCPVHSGRSLIVTERDGKVLLHCKQGCEQAEVLNALRERGLWPERRGENSARPSAKSQSKTAGRPPSGKPASVWDYLDAQGTLIAQHGRFNSADGKKRFAWRLPGDAGWAGLKGLRQSALPLYRASDLRDASPTQPVWLVEGEKAADALAAINELAVSLPGGAAQRDFGAALEALEGRPVVLWPDKDAPGAGLADAAAEALHGLASAVFRVRPPDSLPAGGDVVDFLAAGGKLAGVKPEPVFRDPEVTETVDGYQIVVPLADGEVHFTASDISTRAGKLECHLQVSLRVPGAAREVYAAHIVPDSNSARDAYRRQLDRHFDSDLAKPLIRACIALRATIRDATPAVDLDLVLPRQAGRYLIAPILPDGEPTVMFGDGAVGKTFLALDFAVCVTAEVPFRPGNIAPLKGRAMIVDFETRPTTVRMRLDRLLAGRELSWPRGQIVHWAGGGLSLPQQIGPIERFIRERGITFVIVDSAAAACGGDLNDASAVSAYFNALARLKVTTLTLAHIRKDDSGARHDKAIGSTFWHNAPRATWYVQRADWAALDQIRVGLFCRKMSDGPLERPFGLAMHFVDPDGPVTVQADAVPAQLEPELPLGERVLRELQRATEPMTAPAIAELVDRSANVVRARLSDLATAGKARKRSDGKWEESA